MAHLWIRSSDGAWAVLPLEPRPLSLDSLLLAANEALPREPTPEELGHTAGRHRSGAAGGDHEAGAPGETDAVPDTEPDPADADPAGPDGITLAPLDEDPSSDSWALVAGTGRAIAVNGLPLVTGLRVLADRDELRVGAVSVFFSTERLASVEPFPGAERATFCPRCKKEIHEEVPAVRCPGCGLWHHEDAADARECWSYSGQCASCAHTSDRSEFSWTPEVL